MTMTRSPFRTIDEQRLDDYFTRELKRDRYTPSLSEEGEDWSVFRTSLLSCWDHLGAITPRGRQDGRTFHMAAGFVDIVSPSAFATASEETHLIGMHTGLVGAMLEMSLYLYSQASLFPEVGNAAKERSPPLPPHSPLSFLITGLVRVADERRLRQLSDRITPQDGTRYLHAQLMTLLLLRFTWYHEFYHCVNGHVGLVKDAGIASALCEVGDDLHGTYKAAKEPPIPKLTVQQISHCLEMDADRSALWASAKLQLAGDENIRGLDRLDLRLRMKMVMFSAFLITHFFSESNRRARTPSPFHPSAEIRLHNLVRTIASHLTGEYAETPAIFREVLHEFERLEKAVPRMMRTSDLLRDFESTDFQDSLEAIERNIELVRTATAPFSYV